MNIWSERISFWFGTRPEEVVFEDSRVSTTFAQLESRSMSLVSQFHAHGLQTSDRVLVALPRSNAEAICFAALLRTEMPGLSIERSEIAATFVKTAEAFKPRAVIMLKSDESIATSHFARAASYDLHLDGHNEGLHQLVLIVVDEANPTPHPKEVGWFLQTSGSTGHRRIVMIAKDNLRKRAEQEVEDFGLRSQDLITNALSFSHDLGLNQFLTTLISGARMSIQNQPFASALAKNIRETKPTGVTGTPLMWNRLLQLGEPPFPSLRYVTVSGGSLSLSKLRELQTVFPNAEIIRTYGQTETFRTLMARGTSEESQGRPIQGVQAPIVDSSGNECAIDEIGELIHDGIGSMIGYFNEPIDSHSKMLNSSVRTGDRFSKDASGNFHYAGRADDLVKRFEQRLHVAEIENAIRSFDGIREIAVLARSSPADDIRQTLLCAFAEVQPGSLLTAETILRKCKERLASYQVPDEVRIWATLPRTVSFKIDRQALLAQWIPK